MATRNPSAAGKIRTPQVGDTPERLADDRGRAALGLPPSDDRKWFSTRDVKITVSPSNRRDLIAKCGSVHAHAQGSSAFRCYYVTVFGGHLYECDTVNDLRALISNLANEIN